MSDDEYQDYQAHPEAFFGKVQRPSNKEPKDIFELFEIIVNSYKDTPKESLLEFMKDSYDYPFLKEMDREELVLLYAERCCLNIDKNTTKSPK